MSPIAGNAFWPVAQGSLTRMVHPFHSRGPQRTWPPSKLLSHSVKQGQLCREGSLTEGPRAGDNVPYVQGEKRPITLARGLHRGRLMHVCHAVKWLLDGTKVSGTEGVWGSHVGLIFGRSPTREYVLMLVLIASAVAVTTFYCLQFRAPYWIGRSDMEQSTDMQGDPRASPHG